MLVVFDFDGVIAGTGALHFEAFRSVLADFGVPSDRAGAATNSYPTDPLAADLISEGVHAITANMVQSVLHA